MSFSDRETSGDALVAIIYDLDSKAVTIYFVE